MAAVLSPCVFRVYRYVLVWVYTWTSVVALRRCVFAYAYMRSLIIGDLSYKGRDL